MTDSRIRDIIMNSRPAKVIASQGNLQSRTVYVFSDLNVRDPYVSPSTEVLLYDTKAIVQGVWRLINTQEGEIPNYRNYGLDIKQFLQYPLNSKTIQGIYDYVKGRIETYETRVEVIKSDVDVNFETGRIFMTFFLRMRSSDEVVSLPTWVVQVSTF